MGGITALAEAHGWFLGLILWLCRRLLGAATRLLRWAWRSTLEVAAWLGFQGKRVLIFWFLVYLVLATNWMFGGWVAAKLAAVLFVFAWTAPKRRAMRNLKALREVDQRVAREVGKVTDAVTDAARSIREAGRRPFGGMRHGDDPGQPEQTTMTLAEVAGSDVKFDPVFRLPWRRR